MSTGKPIPEPIRTAAVDDYRSSGDSMTVVAKRHGVSKTALASWINPKTASWINPKTSTRNRKNYNECDGLTGGRWVVVRGVRRWEWFRQPPTDDDLTDHQKRIKAEEDMFTEDEARVAHAAYVYGHRDDRTVVGERVYQRRKKRAQVARKLDRKAAA